jgi:hypothetical protein
MAKDEKPLLSSWKMQADTMNHMMHVLAEAKTFSRLRLCQVHNTNHQPLVNFYVTHTILTNTYAGAHFSCMLCSTARADITRMPTTKCCPKEHLTHKHAWGSQGKILFQSRNTIHTDDKPTFPGRMAQGQHGRLCQNLYTCQSLPVFKFTPCSPVDQRPLHLFHQNTYDQKSHAIIFPNFSRDTMTCRWFWSLQMIKITQMKMLHVAKERPHSERPLATSMVHACHMAWHET